MMNNILIMNKENKNEKLITEFPKVSVITIVFNGIGDIEKTIKSIINQTYLNLEFIVIDGGSTDGTVEIIKKYSSEINYWISEKDNGIYDAMNKGIKNSTGDWLIFMNCGDFFYDNEVIKSISLLFKESIGVIYGNTEITYDFNNSKIKKPKWKKFNKGMPFCTQSAFINKNKISNSSFNTSYSVYGDLDFFIKLDLLQVEMCYNDKLISVFDYNGISSSVSIKKEIEKLSILKKHYGFKSYFYIFNFVDRLFRKILKKCLPISIVRTIQVNK